MYSKSKTSEKPWTGRKVFVGIDTHKKSWKVSVLTENKSGRTKQFSQDPDPQILANFLHENYPGATFETVYEAGFIGFWASKELKNLGIQNIIVNPSDVPTKWKEKVNKSDPVDSFKLARSLRAGELEAIHEPDDFILSIRQYIRRRNQLVKDIARQKNRLKSFFAFNGIQIPEHFSASASRQLSRNYVQWVKDLELKQPVDKDTIQSYLDVIMMLRSELLKVNRNIRLLAQHERIKEDVALLITIPGFGLLTAMSFICELPPIEKFKSADKLNSYVGLTPKVHGSGEKEYVGSLSGRGNSTLRSKLIEASWTAVRVDPVLTLKYEQLYPEMGGAKAIIRIARKMLNRMRMVLLNKQVYKSGIYH